MKIKITNETKQWLTNSEMQEAKTIIASMQEYDGIKDDAMAAARIASRCNDDFIILKCDAEIAGNARVFNYYNDNSGRLDIWVIVFAYSVYAGFYNMGFYLSDIWAATGENGEQIRKHMFVKEYKEIN